MPEISRTLSPVIPGFPEFIQFPTQSRLLNQRENKRSIFDCAARGYRGITGLDLHGRVSLTRGLKDALTTKHRRTGWSCRV